MNTAKRTTQESVERIKIIILEDQYPMFDDQKIQFYLKEFGGDEDRTIYELCCLKATSGQVEVGGLSLPSLDRDFMRIANQYRPNNSGVL